MPSISQNPIVTVTLVTVHSQHSLPYRHVPALIPSHVSKGQASLKIHCDSDVCDGKQHYAVARASRAAVAIVSRAGTTVTSTATCQPFYRHRLGMPQHLSKFNCDSDTCDGKQHHALTVPSHVCTVLSRASKAPASQASTKIHAGENSIVTVMLVTVSVTVPSHASTLPSRAHHFFI